MTSQAFSLNKEDIVKTFHLALTMFGPAILILVTTIQNGQPIDWKYISGMCLTIILETARRYISGQSNSSETPNSSTTI